MSDNIVRDPHVPINYGLMAVKTKAYEEERLLKVVHFCGYEYPPTEHEWREFERELKEDSEFSPFLKSIEGGYTMMVAPQSVIDFMKESIIDAGDYEEVKDETKH